MKANRLAAVAAILILAAGCADMTGPAPELWGYEAQAGECRISGTMELERGAQARDLVAVCFGAQQLDARGRWTVVELSDMGGIVGLRLRADNGVELEHAGFVQGGYMQGPLVVHLGGGRAVYGDFQMTRLDP